MKKIFYLLIVGFTLLGCSSAETVNPSELKIRISNVSEFNYDNIKVGSPDGMVDFGELNAHSKSEYKVFDKAYRYAFVELQIDGETFTLQAIDYVGETLLENRKYAYEINVNSDMQRLMLEFKIE